MDNMQQPSGTGTVQRAAEGLNHAAIRTCSLEKSLRFYKEVLGLEEAFRVCRDDGTPAAVQIILQPGQYLELCAGNPNRKKSLLLHRIRRRLQSAGILHLCLMTPDIRRSCELVKERGGPVDSEILAGQSGGLKFWTHDPDGTRIEIMELTPDSMQAEADRRFAEDHA